MDSHGAAGPRPRRTRPARLETCRARCAAIWPARRRRERIVDSAAVSGRRTLPRELYSCPPAAFGEPNQGREGSGRTLSDVLQDVAEAEYGLTRMISTRRMPASPGDHAERGGESQALD